MPIFKDSPEKIKRKKKRTVFQMNLMVISDESISSEKRSLSFKRTKF
jgi:hypothetical protein